MESSWPFRRPSTAVASGRLFYAVSISQRCVQSMAAGASTGSFNATTSPVILRSHPCTTNLSTCRRLHDVPSQRTPSTADVPARVRAHPLPRLSSDSASLRPGGPTVFCLVTAARLRAAVRCSSNLHSIDVPAGPAGTSSRVRTPTTSVRPVASPVCHTTAARAAATATATRALPAQHRQRLPRPGAARPANLRPRRQRPRAREHGLVARALAVAASPADVRPHAQFPASPEHAATAAGVLRCSPARARAQGSAAH